MLLVLLLGVGRQVEDEEPIRERHLVGGQPDPPRGVHQVEHLLDRRPQIVVDLGHGPRLITKRRMRIIHNTQHDGSSRAMKERTPSFYSEAEHAARFPARATKSTRQTIPVSATHPRRSSPGDCLARDWVCSSQSKTKPSNVNPIASRGWTRFSFGFVRRFEVTGTGQFMTWHHSKPQIQLVAATPLWLGRPSPSLLTDRRIAKRKFDKPPF